MIPKERLFITFYFSVVDKLLIFKQIRFFEVQYFKEFENYFKYQKICIMRVKD